MTDMSEIIGPAQGSLSSPAPPERSTTEKYVPTETELFVRKVTAGYFCVTLNLPRTTAFCNSTSDAQKKVYDKLFNLIVQTLSPELYTQRQYYRVFEHCKSGHIHLHGFVSYQNAKFIPIGLMADMVKNYLKHIGRRYGNYNDKCMFYDLERYRAPPICIQYLDIDDKERINKWEEYLKKEQ